MSFPWTFIIVCCCVLYTLLYIIMENTYQQYNGFQISKSGQAIGYTLVWLRLLPIIRQDQVPFSFIQRHFRLRSYQSLLNTVHYFDTFSCNLIHFFLLFQSFSRFFTHLFNRNHYRSSYHILFFTEVISITLNLILLIHWRILWT